MSYPWFPAELGKPIHDGFSDVFGDGRQITRPDQGIMRVRRKFSAVADMRNYSYFWTVAQNGIFERFYLVTIKEGLVPFWMYDPKRDSLPLTDQNDALLTDQSDVGILTTAPQLLLLGQQLPTSQPRGVGYTVSFSVERLPV
jgi:hypothetical protein